MATPAALVDCDRISVMQTVLKTELNLQKGRGTKQTRISAQQQDNGFPCSDQALRIYGVRRATECKYRC